MKTAAELIYDQYELDFEEEGQILTRRLQEICTSSKLISVQKVETRNDDPDGPLFVTLRIDPIPYSEAVKRYVKEPEARRGANHLH